MFKSKKKEGEDQIQESTGQEVEMTNKNKDDTSAGEASGGLDALKRGDYMIHIFLEKVKEIKTEPGCTVDPIFEVTCLNQKQYSSAKSKIGGISEVVYSEHLFLEAQNVEKNDAKEAKIVIKLSDKGIFKNTLIGLFEFDLGQIYLKPQHALLHKWLALSNPTSEKYSEITGYVKLSINVTQTGDESIQINDDEGPEDTDILMPPSLNPKFYQLKFRLFKCMELPAMDQAIGGGVIAAAKTDAYVRTEYKGKKYKSSVITMLENGPAIDWNQEIWIPAQIPIIYPRVVLNVMDYDTSGDEVVGSLLFDLQDIVSGKYKGKFFWKNIYGSAMNQSNSEHKRNMNENPELASNWKGRILINIDCEETEKPVAKVSKIEAEHIIESKQHCIPQKYHIHVEFGQGVALPASKKYQLKLIVGGHTIMSGEAKNKIKTNYNNFNSRQYKLAELPYQTMDDMGKLILLLMDGSSPVCYYKDDIANYNEPNAQYKWVQLQPDLCVGKVKDPNLAGIVSFKLSVIKHDDNAPIDFKKFTAWKRPPLERLEPAKIRVYIYQARDLPAADATGDSDPFITVWDTSEKQKKTDIVEDNTNPSYYQTLELDYEVRDFNDISTYPPFILDVFDSDTGLLDSNDDFLGRAMISAKDCKLSHQKDFQRDPLLEIPDKPTWHPIQFAVGEPNCGEILCSFSVSAQDYKYVYAEANTVDLKSTVQFMEFDVNMLILGLRSLQSPGILPVQKAFIIFNVKSLVPNDIASISNIQTTPKASGPNPTINTTINFSIPMPADPLFAPKLSCSVYDQIFKGFSQPQIGVFVIPMGQLVLDLKHEREEETAEIEKINHELRKIMKQAGLEVKDYNAPKNIKSINDSRVFSNEEQNIIGKKVARLQNDASGLDDSDIDLLIDNERRGSVSQLTNKKRKAPQSRHASKHQKSNGNQDTDNNITETFEVDADDAEDNAAKRRQEIMLKLQEQKEKIKSGQIARKGTFQRGKIKQEKTDHEMLGLNKSEVEAIFKEQKEKEKRFKEQERERAQENLLAEGLVNNSVVVMPKYELDARLKVDREFGIPSGELFIGLGWDENKETKRKHYRQYYPDELENVKEIFPKPSPFNTFNLKKGQSRGLSSGGFMSLFKKTKKDESGQASTEKVVGIFKAIIEVKSKKDEQEYIIQRQNLLLELKNNLQAIAQQKIGQQIEIDYEKLGSAMERRSLDVQLRRLDVSHLNITKHIADLESDEILKRQLMCKVKCIVRFYAISAFNLSSRDNGSASDPYLILKCNNKVYNERSIYQLDEPNPKFLKHYDFEGHFPGCSPLEIGVWDYDDIFGDDLIGSTIVDLEDRYFSIEWQSLQEKPIEYRQIYHETSSQEQGVVKCWVEINPTDDPNPVTLWDIRDKPPEPIEVRVAIFNADGIPMMDWEGTCDCFFRNFFDSKEDVQETDTHFRNQDGKPDFQYRLIYKIQVPRKDYKLHIQAYDRDFFKSNDMIGEATIDLQQILEDCCLIKKPLGLNEEYYKSVLKDKNFQKLEFDSKDKSRFWLQMRNKDEHGKEIKTGKVKVQIDILPQEQADKNPVGKARDTPNHSPSLPQPEGRIELSLNPIKMFNQMVGPAVRRQICYWFICFVCTFLMLYMIPGLISSIIANFISNTINNATT